MAGLPLESKLIRKFIAALAISAPFFAHAAPHAVDMSCGMTVKAFFAPLVQSRVLNPKQVQVNDRSVNYFQPRLFKEIAVYGMPVVYVFGYTDEPLLFVNNGNSAWDTYGVVVRESIANVQAQLNSMQAGAAQTYRVDARTTAITCKGESA